MKIQVISRYIAFLVVLAFSSHSFAEVVWIDVRTSFEHKIDNIEGDTRISYAEVVPEVETMFPDKNTPIRLYCRSGGRAGTAEQALKEAGYTDVENIGGIDDARKYRGIEE